jgi:hypothetical protein
MVRELLSPDSRREHAMTNDFNGVSNWTMATGTKPGERYVYCETPPTPVTHPTPAAWLCPAQGDEDRLMTLAYRCDRVTRSRRPTAALRGVREQAEVAGSSFTSPTVLHELSVDRQGCGSGAVTGFVDNVDLDRVHDDECELHGELVWVPVDGRAVQLLVQLPVS